MAQTKTNVMRILEQKKVPYQAHSYPHGKEPVDGMTVARLLGRTHGRFTKRWLPTDTAKIIMFSSSRWKARWI